MNLETVIRRNFAMISSLKQPENREEFLQEVRRKNFDLAVIKYIDNISTWAKIMCIVRWICGSKNYCKVRSRLRKD